MFLTFQVKSVTDNFYLTEKRLKVNTVNVILRNIRSYGVKMPFDGIVNQVTSS